MIGIKYKLLLQTNFNGISSFQQKSQGMRLNSLNYKTTKNVPSKGTILVVTVSKLTSIGESSNSNYYYIVRNWKDDSEIQAHAH